MTWILEHWADLLAIYGGLVAIATIIVKLTPSTKDNEILDKIIKFFDHFSTSFTKEDAEKLANATKKLKK
jgi:hypothetical protein